MHTPTGNGGMLEDWLFGDKFPKMKSQVFCYSCHVCAFARWSSSSHNFIGLEQSFFCVQLCISTFM